MAHCGYEPTAADAAFANPFKMVSLAMFGIRTSGPMAKEILLDKQRPAAYVHSLHVERELANLKKSEERPQRLTAAE
jgi:hypothetical protein